MFSAIFHSTNNPDDVRSTGFSRNPGEEPPPNELPRKFIPINRRPPPERLRNPDSSPAASLPAEPGSKFIFAAKGVRQFLVFW
jgi:hypothetical protein